MPLPIIIAGIAAAAGLAGVGSGIHGGMKMKEANDTMKSAQSIQETAIENFNTHSDDTTKLMDELGSQELEILKSFDTFSNIIEKIQGRPDFKAYSKDGVDLPAYEEDALREISAGAGVLLGGIGGAAFGTAGGFAAAGATTSAVMALGTASTGTAISTLSGVAATNATLAAIGGGSLAAGGGGMALGTALLGGATLGVGLLVGGVIFNVTGSKLSDKADEAYNQATKTKEEVNKIVDYLNSLSSSAKQFKDALTTVDKKYRKHVDTLHYIVNFSGQTDWNNFSEKEKQLTENTVLLVGLLYKMCQTKLVLKGNSEDQLNTVNKKEIEKSISDSKEIMSTIEQSEL